MVSKLETLIGLALLAETLTFIVVSKVFISLKLYNLKVQLHVSQLNLIDGNTYQNLGLVGC